MLGPKEIQQYLPHRYPFLLVDRIVEIAADGTRIVGLKCVSFNEPFFQGHFPDDPIMPGVLIIEALAQAGGVLVAQAPGNRGKRGYLAGVDGFRFRRPVRPGDTLRLEVTLTKRRAAVGVMHAKATVDGQVVAEGEIMFVLAPG